FGNKKSIMIGEARSLQLFARTSLVRLAAGIGCRGSGSFHVHKRSFRIDVPQMSPNRFRQLFLDTQSFAADSEAQPEQLRIEHAGYRSVKSPSLDYTFLDFGELHLAKGARNRKALRSALAGVREFFPSQLR